MRPQLLIRWRGLALACVATTVLAFLIDEHSQHGAILFVIGLCCAARALAEVVSRSWKFVDALPISRLSFWRRKLQLGLLLALLLSMPAVIAHGFWWPGLLLTVLGFAIGTITIAAAMHVPRGNLIIVYALLLSPLAWGADWLLEALELELRLLEFALPILLANVLMLAASACLFRARSPGPGWVASRLVGLSLLVVALPTAALIFHVPYWEGPSEINYSYLNQSTESYAVVHINERRRVAKHVVDLDTGFCLRLPHGVPQVVIGGSRIAYGCTRRTAGFANGAVAAVLAAAV
ncbi:MAG: hypothetical protein ACI8W8_004690 [Rhodothermales bacterium]|jgi:hypothetical protein